MGSTSFSKSTGRGFWYFTESKMESRGASWSVLAKKFLECWNFQPERPFREIFVTWPIFFIPDFWNPVFELYRNSSRSSGWVNHRTKILERRSHGSELPTICNSRLNSPGRSIRSGPVSRTMSTRCGRSMRSSFRKKAEVNILNKNFEFAFETLLWAAERDI